MAYTVNTAHTCGEYERELYAVISIPFQPLIKYHRILNRFGGDVLFAISVAAIACCVCMYFGGIVIVHTCFYFW